MRTLTANIVMEMGYASGLHREALIATGVVLFVFILLINLCFSLLKMEDGLMRDIHGLPAVNRVSLRQRARSYLRRPLSLLLFLLVGLAALLTAATLLFIIGYILVRGVAHITPSLL